MKKSNSLLLPNISIIEKKRKKFSTIQKLTDDINFAKIQIDKINKTIKTRRDKEIKPWLKFSRNNIYNYDGKSNYTILRYDLNFIKLFK